VIIRNLELCVEVHSWINSNVHGLQCTCTGINYPLILCLSFSTPCSFCPSISSPAFSCPAFSVAPSYTDLIYSSSLRQERSARGVKIGPEFWPTHFAGPLRRDIAIWIFQDRRLGRHLVFVKTGNSAIRSADPENHHISTHSSLNYVLMQHNEILKTVRSISLANIGLYSYCELQSHLFSKNLSADKTAGAQCETG